MTPLEQLWAAVNVEGPVPRYHREVMARHRAEWPVLWEAIDRLLDDRRMKLLDEIYSFRSVTPTPEYLEAIEEAKAVARKGSSQLRRGDRVRCVNGPDRGKTGSIVRHGEPGYASWWGAVFLVLFDGETEPLAYGEEWLERL